MFILHFGFGTVLYVLHSLVLLYIYNYSIVLNTFSLGLFIFYY